MVIEATKEQTRAGTTAGVNLIRDRAAAWFLLARLVDPADP
jgi:hypothetical protein